MSQLTKRGKKTPVIRQTALALVRRLPQKDKWGEIKALHSFVQNNIRYTRDIRGIETVHYAEQVLAQGQGDCDDKSILIASMLEAIGFRTRFVAVAMHGGPFTHVFPQVKFGKKWVTLECTEPVNIGWYPPNVTRTLIRHN